jgi:hypothetical protein
MRIERHPGDSTHRLKHRNSKRDIGDEVPVHHVEMNHVGAGRFDLGVLLAQAREVGGKN